MDRATAVGDIFLSVVSGQSKEAINDLRRCFVSEQALFTDEQFDAILAAAKTVKHVSFTERVDRFIVRLAD